ncbi:uncharacterized protein N7503_002195 [Penicillium pulvis]|uniref:uncharacterized protein n=1 Tax=Penicillium pulvis TaxID=1562058 RepID=UPI0025481D59|nr:uncharacterized protein N7503_002195 [Penicillium pulvis]KAJ5809977.1 hypothetical protein N7503_002195 [Penicillium pulvis]
MPLVVYKQSKRTHAVLPVALTTTNSLIITLIYLQFLYLVSYIARPFCSSAQEFPPFKYQIERTEKRVIDLIFSIVPFSNYRSPNPSTILQHQPLSQRSNSGGAYPSTSRLTIDGVPNMPQPPSTAFTTPPIMPQCYPETAIERMPSRQSIDPKLGVGAPINKPSAVADRYAKTDVPIYEIAVKRISPPNRTRVSVPGITDKGKGTNPVQASSTPALLLAQHSIHSVHEHKFGASVEERSEDGSEHLLPLHQVHHNTEILDLATPSGSMTHIPNLELHVGRKSPVASLGSLNSLVGPVDPISALQSMSSGSSEEGSGVRMDRGTKCHSTESYPGKFPVSEGVEFSGLATAEYAFREKGTTTVRPFSDY